METPLNDSPPDKKYPGCSFKSLLNEPAFISFCLPALASRHRSLLPFYLRVLAAILD